jgi:16S rRNA (uracil1498-N3)-methyltransferase
MDFIVQKATELGVHRLSVLTTRFSEPQSSTERNQKQIARWQRIMLSACKQCKRGQPMELLGPVSPDAIAPPADGLALLLNEAEKTQSFHTLALNRPISSLCLVIGPEGGWHPDEIALLIDQGAHSISLGPLTLRAETAVISALAIGQFLLGSLRPTV